MFNALKTKTILILILTQLRSVGKFLHWAVRTFRAPSIH